MIENGKIKLNVEGMTCGHCQKAVKDALEGLAGVTRAEVNLEEGTALIEGSTSVQLLIGAIQDEGYRASVA